MKVLYYILILQIFFLDLQGRTIHVGERKTYHSIIAAISDSQNGDTIYVHAGIYKEGNIHIKKSISLIGINKPILDGEGKYEILTINANGVLIQGFRIQHSGYASLEDPAGIKIYNSTHVTIKNNELDDTFFGIYLSYSLKCLVKDNTLKSYNTEEQRIGNGVHCWKSDSLQIIGNKIDGHRDGIYFEFVTHSIIWRNISNNNIRYGLHFMFSNTDVYISNVFKGNGAGVAVMFTREVTMINNTFSQNWGDASYGLLLKEISDSYILGNNFSQNTSGIFMEGTSRIHVQRNNFEANGWGMKIQASCMDNEIMNNNFVGNTFDISTNGSLVLNTFNSNYWDKYEGYDLNKDNLGDVPYHPLSIFSVIVEKNPPAMLLFRSFMVSLLDKSEKMIPSLTPDNFIDNSPLMHALKL